MHIRMCASQWADLHHNYSVFLSVCMCVNLVRCVLVRRCKRLVSSSPMATISTFKLQHNSVMNNTCESGSIVYKRCLLLRLWCHIKLNLLTSNVSCLTHFQCVLFLQPQTLTCFIGVLCDQPAYRRKMMHNCLLTTGWGLRLEISRRG